MSNESPSSHGLAGYGGSASRQAAPEETLKTEKVQIERKTFVLSLKQNARGRFLRITEDVNGRRDTIIVPSTGLSDFRRVLDEIVKANEV